MPCSSTSGVAPAGPRQVATWIRSPVSAAAGGDGWRMTNVECSAAGCPCIAPSLSRTPPAGAAQSYGIARRGRPGQGERLGFGEGSSSRLGRGVGEGGGGEGDALGLGFGDGGRAVGDGSGLGLGLGEDGPLLPPGDGDGLGEGEGRGEGVGPGEEGPP